MSKVLHIIFIPGFVKEKTDLKVFIKGVFHRKHGVFILKISLVTSYSKILSVLIHFQLEDIQLKYMKIRWSDERNL